MSSGGLAARYGVAKSFTHSRLDAQHVVVDSEHALLGVGAALLEGDRHLGVVDAGEVAGAGWLVLLWLQSEGVHIDTWVWVAGVVVEWLSDVVVLTWLSSHAILAVQNQLELGQRTNLNTQDTGYCAVIRRCVR